MKERKGTMWPPINFLNMNWQNPNVQDYLIWYVIKDKEYRSWILDTTYWHHIPEKERERLEEIKSIDWSVSKRDQMSVNSKFQSDLNRSSRSSTRSNPFSRNYIIHPHPFQVPISVKVRSAARIPRFRVVNRRWDPLFTRLFVRPSVGATTTDSRWVFGRRSSDFLIPVAALRNRSVSLSRVAMRYALSRSSSSSSSSFLLLRSVSVRLRPLPRTPRHGGLMKM